jgi:hypothetical protein
MKAGKRLRHTSTMLLSIGMALGGVESRAQEGAPILPHLHKRMAEYYRAHPAEWNQFLSRLPRPAGTTPQATTMSQATPAPSTPTGATGSWSIGSSKPSGASLGYPLLLTDGTVITGHGANRWKLTPDSKGNYATGTWSKIASLPLINGVQYAPTYFASAVLPDGRVIIQGGEYDTAGIPANPGAIYDPAADAWTPVMGPSGASYGDDPSIVLPNGVFMLSYGSQESLFNPSTLSWSSTGRPKGWQPEAGLTLLPNDKVLTIDTYDQQQAEVYDPSTGLWSVTKTPVQIPACYEIGPAVTRFDGTTVAFGVSPACTATSPAPTAIYTASTNSWVQGPNIPAVNGVYYDLADAPAVMLPNGNILFAASPGAYKTPTHFFEFGSAANGNTITQAPDPVYFSNSLSSYYYIFLMLPNGQVLVTDTSNVVEFYTPSSGVVASAMPTVTSLDACVTPGKTYQLQGTQLNGLTQGAAYGDDAQSATNYPLVRIVNNATGNVFYARTSGFSTMSIAPGRAGSTNYVPAANTETGASTLYVVANGVASAGTPITVGSSCAPATLAVTATQPLAASGPVGGPFTGGSGSYTLTAQNGSLNYSITSIPTWVTVTGPTTGKLAAGASTTVSFTVNSQANNMQKGAYAHGMRFANTTDGKGSTVEVATLIIK